MEKHYGNDPGCVVIDEVVGMQVILVGASGVGVWGGLISFFVFRVFDVLKPFPIGRSQKLPGGWGVVVVTRRLLGIGPGWCGTWCRGRSAAPCRYDTLRGKPAISSACHAYSGDFIQYTASNV